MAARNRVIARSVWLPDAWRVASNQEGAMPRIERRRLQGRPVIVTGRVTGKRPCGEAEGREGVPDGFSQQLQGGGRGVDEGGGDIARVFVFGAGAVRFLGMLGGRVLLFGAATGDLFLLRSGDAAPAHREADAEGEDQGCEAGEHVVLS